ncbi:hypothetical protein [Iodobacter sp.]|uniref:hypothetical protein n=1 Tax=Iodobacter sp. TaxID=1915058 RepID=UPI0025CEA287|nr:hypothetical protein [Iodobacter sp.]
MRITQSDLQLSSQQASSSETLKSLQVGQKVGLDQQGAGLFADFFNEQLSALSSGLEQAKKQEQAEKDVDKSKEQRFQSLWEMLFGNGQPPTQSAPPPCPNDSPAATPTATAAPVSSKAYNLQILAIEHTKTTESCNFNASGKVCLSDGNSRQFDVGYQNAQSSETTRIAGAEWFKIKDPLVVDTGAATIKLSPQSVAFDLDNDGKTETMRLPDTGSGLLFLDRNHNGIADNGSELFGPQSGNGFSELAKLDDDHNGWIDEGDTAYKDLKLWQSGEPSRGRVQTLAEAGVGAMATQSAATEFSLREEGNVLGQIRASSVWLGEHSGAGTVRQIDLVTQPQA